MISISCYIDRKLCQPQQYYFGVHDRRVPTHLPCMLNRPRPRLSAIATGHTPNQSSEDALHLSTPNAVPVSCATVHIDIELKCLPIAMLRSLILIPSRVQLTCARVLRRPHPSGSTRKQRAVPLYYYCTFPGKTPTRWPRVRGITSNCRIYRMSVCLCLLPSETWLLSVTRPYRLQVCTS